jgi:hypothetical protein
MPKAENGLKSGLTLRSLSQTHWSQANINKENT